MKEVVTKLRERKAGCGIRWMSSVWIISGLLTASMTSAMLVKAIKEDVIGFEMYVCVLCVCMLILFHSLFGIK